MIKVDVVDGIISLWLAVLSTSRIVVPTTCGGWELE